MGTLNEILGTTNSKDGMSRPNRYEVTLYFHQLEQEVLEEIGQMYLLKLWVTYLGDGTVRATGLRCERYLCLDVIWTQHQILNIYGTLKEKL